MTKIRTGIAESSVGKRGPLKILFTQDNDNTQTNFFSFSARVISMLRILQNFVVAHINSAILDKHIKINLLFCLKPQ